ncbi:neocarzinostatin apoprotein domain-containing protein [Nocardioides sp.]|uniref:neocarzinostatin apoprotein domain-containing protein n=1 Tax=Nocardioides sp. TaxID=35761 RepID=UPI00356336A3
MRTTKTNLSTRVGRVLLAAVATLAIVIGVAAPAFAAPSLVVSATEGLTEGQTITIDGSGFAPNLKGIAVGQCRVGFTGPADCNLSGGATFRNADADGNIDQVTVKVSLKFGDVDCTVEQCIIAAEPLPTTSGPEEVAANSVSIPIYFGDAKPAGTAPAVDTGAAAPAAPAAAPVAAALPAGDVSDAAVALTSAEADNTVLVVLIVTNLALVALGLYFGLGFAAKRSRGRKAVAR